MGGSCWIEPFWLQRAWNSVNVQRDGQIPEWYRLNCTALVIKREMMILSVTSIDTSIQSDRVIFLDRSLVSAPYPKLTATVEKVGVVSAAPAGVPCV
jgi:hypothetical protein